ncbi:hypothetical protein EYF80_037342 [Liparis tanakae]|uniref:Uncharacterized protein n=1 Tax=Liparis tanakae TaxID=230148 RepID=A0A4Z2GIC5_9TELE|nr:hypothetical protein EYF80_037342 [Liparis tanakae]
MCAASLMVTLLVDGMALAVVFWQSVDILYYATLLRADGEILPPAGGGQDCYIYSERLTGGVGRGSEAHLAAVPAQDGVAHELLSINLQLVGILQRTLQAHLLNTLLT